MFHCRLTRRGCGRRRSRQSTRESEFWNWQNSSLGVDSFIAIEQDGNGDVWIASGIDRALERVQWRRFASGLYEPLNLQVVRDTIYLLDRQGIVRLHEKIRAGVPPAYEIRGVAE